VLTGCSSKKPAANSPATTAATSASAAPVASSSASAAPAGGTAAGLQNLAQAIDTNLKGDPAAKKIVEQAVGAVLKVSSVHIKGNVTDSGQNVTFDLAFGKGAGAVGSATYQGGTINLMLANDTLYVKGDQKIFAAAGAAMGGSNPQLAALAGKWLKLSLKTPAGASSAPSSNPLSGLDKFADPNNLASQINKSTSTTTVTVADKKTVNGESATGLKFSDSTDPTSNAIIYVADKSHLPLEIVPTAAPGSTTSGTIDFVDYNKPVSVTPPADAVDMTQLLSMFGGGAGSSPAA